MAKVELSSRRERLAEAAGRFYRQLVEDAEVHGTDGSEIVEVTRVGKRFTDLTVRRPSESGEPHSGVVSVRRFDAAETREIRVYLHGGNDRVVVRGHATGRTIVRVIAGAGRTTFADSTAGGGAERIRYYAESEASAAEPRTRARIDRRPYVAPQTSRGWIDPPRDWGTRRSWAPWASYSPDAGLFLGGGPTFERYGFRQHPYAARMSLLAGYAAGVNRWRAEFTADLRREGSAMHATVVARASELDILHFHGFGNETSAPGPKAFHRVEQRAFGVEPMLHVPLARHLTLGLGATARHATTGPDSGRFIAATRPFGVGSFGQIGARARLTFDSRDTPAFATRGIFATLQGAQYPGIWSAEGPFGAVRAQAATYLSAPLRLRPVLALRVGGDRVWGEYPFFDAAFLGGASTLRGWREERFAGDASLYGNAELRVVLAKVSLLLPADLGAFGLADGGRVFISEERSDAWHTAFGGGLWVSFLGRANTFSIAAARGREGTGIYFRTGMLF